VTHVWDEDGRSVYLTRVLGLMAVYVATAYLGLELAFFQENATLIWPPTGLSLAALLLYGWRYWPGVALGSYLINLINQADPVVSLAISVGSTLEAVVGAVLLGRYFDFRPTLARVRDVVSLTVVGGVFACMISAGIGVTALWYNGAVPTADFVKVLLIWWRGGPGRGRRADARAPPAARGESRLERPAARPRILARGRRPAGHVSRRLQRAGEW